MAARVPIRVAGFVLLAACGALCQERQEKMALSPLPDAPSASAQAAALRTLPEEAPSPLSSAGDPGASRESGFAGVNRAAQSGYSLSYKSESAKPESDDFFAKHLYPSLLKRSLNYHPSSSSSLMGRATYAASRLLVTQDSSGRGRLNSSYLLGVLSSAAVHMAYRPSWARSASAPLSDFGSTLGNDAGMSLFHEFGPGLNQLLRNHAPRFVTKIEDRIGR